jgi:hypothetical protein
MGIFQTQRNVFNKSIEINLSNIFHPKFSIEAWHLEWFIGTKVTKVAP